jgi:hypothetical protein
LKGEFKGTRTQDYNSVLVAWFDRSWLGPAFKCCPLFKRELLVSNLFAGFKNKETLPLAGFQKLSAQL